MTDAVYNDAISLDKVGITFKCPNLRKIEFITFSNLEIHADISDCDMCGHHVEYEYTILDCSCGKYHRLYHPEIGMNF